MLFRSQNTNRDQNRDKMVAQVLKVRYIAHVVAQRKIQRGAS